MKKCSKCGERKEKSEFYKRWTSKDGLASSCKSCCKIARSIYYQEYKERIMIVERQYREDNKDKVYQRKKIYRENNKDRISIKKKQYYQAHKDKICANVYARRKSVAKPDIETIDHIIWCKKELCFYCGNVGGTHDHIIPLSKGGSNTKDNIVPCCSKCNDSKGSKLVEDWHSWR